MTNEQVIRDALEAAQRAIQAAQRFPSTGDLYKQWYAEAIQKIDAAFEKLEQVRP